MTTLAERVEAADGPDRKLDAAIRCELFAPPGAFVEQSPINGAWCIYIDRSNGKRVLWEASRNEPDNRGEFTASIDAAMTLAGDVRVILNIAEDGITTAIVDGTQGVGLTAALALTAAALRARESKP